MAFGQNDFDVVKSIIRAIGRGGPWKSRLFWAQMALASFVIIQGQKNLDFQGPSLPMALVMDVTRIKIITPHTL
jgi:hypothetical protein